MLNESRASDAVIYDCVAEIPRFLNVYTCAKTIRPSPYNALKQKGYTLLGIFEIP